MSRAMQEIKPQVQAYLDRIGYKGPLDGSAEALANLQERHLHSVPYENLDILQGKPLSLHIPDLIDKIVYRRRGGYCFELNALFGWLLRELGYPVTDFVARFWRDEANPPPKRRHQVLRVEAEGRSFLCDVGVGGIVPRRPVAIVEGLEQEQGDELYKLVRDAQYGWMLQEFKKGDWHAIYSFTEEPQFPNDYLFASFWCERADESIFRQKPMVAMRTKEGRNTIAGEEFRIFTSGGVQVIVPKTQEEYKDALQKYFGIHLDD